jgi:alpha-amylase
MMNTSLEEMVTTETGLSSYNSSVWQERWVPTNWDNAQIKDFTGNSLDTYNTKRYVGENTSPPNGYSVWSINM